MFPKGLCLLQSLQHTLSERHHMHVASSKKIFHFDFMEGCRPSASTSSVSCPPHAIHCEMLLNVNGRFQRADHCKAYR